MRIDIQAYINWKEYKLQLDHVITHNNKLTDKDKKALTKNMNTARDLILDYFKNI